MGTRTSILNICNETLLQAYTEGKKKKKSLIKIGIILETHLQDRIAVETFHVEPHQAMGTTLSVEVKICTWL